MSLLSYALTTLEGLKNYMQKNDSDFQVPVLTLYNSSGDATASTYEITTTGMRLIVTTGANAHDTTLTFADANKDTITELATAITALAKGWIVNVIANGSANSTDLTVIGATGCLLIANVKSIFATDNFRLEVLINSATEFIEGYCHRRFIETTYTDELYDGNGSDMLILKQFPVSSITSIYWRYMLSPDVQISPATNYDLYEAEGMVANRVGLWRRGRQNIKITYVAGYDFATDGIPADLQDICNQLCALKIQEPDRAGISSEKTMTYSVAYTNESIPADLKLRMDLWRKVAYNDTG